MPNYTNASYGGEMRVLENDCMRVEVYKRITGWAYAEIYTRTGKMMGVIPFLSELQESLGGKRGITVMPRRLESPDVREEKTDDADTLVFDVHSMIHHEYVKGSFLEFMADPSEKPYVTGQVRLSLLRGKGVLSLDYRLNMRGLSGYAALRGPWLLAGADSFGLAKTDAVFPGIEWLRSNEWSSNQNYMLYPLSERTAPHPFKVSVPMMAVSHEGCAISLSWDPLRPVTEFRPMSVTYYPQPVFSSPDAVNHANQHLMGIMLPSSAYTGRENDPRPAQITPCGSMNAISFQAEIALSEGNSLDALVDYVKRHGLPEPAEPPKSLRETLEFIAQCYDSNLWHDNKGWSCRTERDMTRNSDVVNAWYCKPAHMERFINEYADTDIARKLKAKYEIASKHQSFIFGDRDPRYVDDMTPVRRKEFADDLLSIQKPDGSFVFEPANPKSLTYANPAALNQAPFAANLHKALGEPGDTSLETNVVPAFYLMRASELTGNKAYLEAALKALDFCMDMIVSDGGDIWETPLHSPNLLAAGHASIAYEIAFRESGIQKYRDKAIYWLRGLLAFTHLWEPKGVHDLYCTKPCFCGTDWATTSWVDVHVQWEVILSLASASILGIDWSEVDTEIDWNRYIKGITTAATHWLLDSSKAGDLPFDIDLGKGHLDGMIADQHDPLTGELFGWQLFPEYLAVLIMDALKRDKHNG